MGVSGSNLCWMYGSISSSVASWWDRTRASDTQAHMARSRWRRPVHRGNTCGSITPTRARCPCDAHIASAAKSGWRWRTGQWRMASAPTDTIARQQHRRRAPVTAPWVVSPQRRREDGRQHACTHRQRRASTRPRTHAHGADAAWTGRPCTTQVWRWGSKPVAMSPPSPERRWWRRPVMRTTPQQGCSGGASSCFSSSASLSHSRPCQAPHVVPHQLPEDRLSSRRGHCSKYGAIFSAVTCTHESSCGPSSFPPRPLPLRLLGMMARHLRGGDRGDAAFKGGPRAGGV